MRDNIIGDLLNGTLNYEDAKTGILAKANELSGKIQSFAPENGNQESTISRKIATASGKKSFEFTIKLDQFKKAYADLVKLIEKVFEVMDENIKIGELGIPEEIDFNNLGDVYGDAIEKFDNAIAAKAIANS